MGLFSSCWQEVYFAQIWNPFFGDKTYCESTAYRCAQKQRTALCENSGTTWEEEALFRPECASIRRAGIPTVFLMRKKTPLPLGFFYKTTR